MTAKVKIEAGTAKYYLRLEHAFNRLCEHIGVDPDVYMQNYEPTLTQNDRYQYRCDLHDAWEAVVAKRPYHPTRKGNSAGIPDVTLKSIKGGTPGHGRLPF